MFSLEDLLCSVDDLCQSFEARWQRQLLADGLQHRRRKRSLCRARDYDDSDCLPSILLPQFQSLLPGEGASAAAECLSRLSQQESGLWSGYPVPCCRCVPTCAPAKAGVQASVFKGSTSLKVCHNRRIQQHKVFKELAARGKTSVDWFFGNKAASGGQ
jgi:hypothetical protein